MPASIHQFKARVGADPFQTEDVSVSLAEGLRSCFGEHAQVLLERFFEVADDRLFEYGGRSGGESQAGYLQAMRALRGQRDAVRQGFTRTIAEQLQPSWRPHGVVRGSDDKLRLIEDRIVEERLAVETTRQRIENNCGETLYEFRQRLEGARRQYGLPLLDAQFGPIALCTALHEGLRTVGIQLDLLVVLLKIFEQVARAEVQRVYEQLNALMDAAGIAFAGAKPAARGAAAPAAAAAAAASADAAPPAAPAAPTVSPALPAAAIAAIRGLAANVAALGELLAQSTGAPAQRAFNAQLQEALHSAHQPAGPEWAQAVALRAAAGAWLFDELLGDTQLAVKLRQELGGLRSPFVRASLQEERFLSDAAHPLRQLVQDLAALTVTAKLGRSEELSGICGLIREMGARLQAAPAQRDLQGTSGVDEATLEGFTEAVREVARLRRERLVQRARDLATEAIDRGVQRHLPAAELPECVALALEKAFGPLLGLILLRWGPGCDALRHAQSLLDEFLGTVAHGTAGLPSEAGFAARVAQAAAQVGFSAGRQEELRAQVETAFRSGPLPTRPPAACADEGTAPSGLPRLHAPGLEVAEVSDGELQACAKDLFTPGSWFCARSSDGPGEKHWMQVERCDPAQGQVRFRGLLGTPPVVRPLQRLLFEVLCGECQHISSNLHQALAVAKLTQIFGMEAAA